MNKLSITAIIILLVTGFVACDAQQGQNGPGGRGQGNFDPDQMAERQVSRIAEALELTDDQKDKTLDLFKEFGEKQRDLRRDAEGDREEMRAKMQEINAERDEEFKKILTEDQWNKWEEIRGEFQRRRGRRQNELNS